MISCESDATSTESSSSHAALKVSATGTETLEIFTGFWYGRIRIAWVSTPPVLLVTASLTTPPSHPRVNAHGLQDTGMLTGRLANWVVQLQVSHFMIPCASRLIRQVVVLQVPSGRIQDWGIIEIVGRDSGSLATTISGGVDEVTGGGDSMGVVVFGVLTCIITGEALETEVATGGIAKLRI